MMIIGNISPLFEALLQEKQANVREFEFILDHLKETARREDDRFKDLLKEENKNKTLQSELDTLRTENERLKHRENVLSAGHLSDAEIREPAAPSKKRAPAEEPEKETEEQRHTTKESGRTITTGDTQYD